MSKYLVTMTDGKMNMSFNGSSFRNESSGSSNGRLNFVTKICEFKGELPTESEIKRIAEFHSSKYVGDYFINHIVFMQKLEDEDEVI